MGVLGVNMDCVLWGGLCAENNSDDGGCLLIVLTGVFFGGKTRSSSSSLCVDTASDSSESDPAITFFRRTRLRFFGFSVVGATVSIVSSFCVGCSCTGAVILRLLRFIPIGDDIGATFGVVTDVPRVAEIPLYSGKFCFGVCGFLVKNEVIVFWRLVGGDVVIFPSLFSCKYSTLGWVELRWMAKCRVL